MLASSGLGAAAGTLVGRALRLQDPADARQWVWDVSKICLGLISCTYSDGMELWSNGVVEKENRDRKIIGRKNLWFEWDNGWDIGIKLKILILPFTTPTLHRSNTPLSDTLKGLNNYDKLHRFTHDTCP